VVDAVTPSNSGTESFEQLADELRRIAEIGRIVSSSLDLADVYSLLAENVRTLVRADRMVIAIMSEDGTEWVDRYIDGVRIPGESDGSSRRIEDSDASTAIIVDKVPAVYAGSDIRGYNVGSSEEKLRQKTGLNSLMMLPLLWQGSSYGVLAFRAFDPDAFGQHQIEIGQQIASQIAGAIATSSQFSLLERESSDRKQLAEINRIMGASLNLAEIFDEFAVQTQNLVPFDRLVLTAHNASGTVIGRHIHGMDVVEPNPPPISPAVLQYMSEKVGESSTYFVKNGRAYETYAGEQEQERVRFGLGLRAMLSVPLVWRGNVVGSLTFRSKDPSAYDDHEIEVAHRIANEVANAVHASNQFVLLENESLEREHLASIGRIVSSTTNLDEVFTAFAEAAGELVSFDRLAISIINAEINQIIDTHVTGQTFKEGNLSGPFSLEDSVVPRVVYEDHRVFVANSTELSKLAEFDTAADNRIRLAAGLKSVMFAPVVLQGVAVGTLVFRSKQDDPYHEREIRLAEQIAAHIAGVISANQQRALIEIESAERQRLAEEQARIAEIGRIVSSTLDLDEVFSRFVDEARALLPFDRIVILTVSPDGSECTDALVEGVDKETTPVGTVQPSGNNPLQERVIDEQIQIMLGGEEYLKMTEINPAEKLRLDSGLNSLLMSPMIWQGNVIGVVNLRSKLPDAYGEHEADLARQISAQIAGAIATANQYRQLQESETSYRGLIENSHILVYTVSPEGRFTYVNSAVEQSFGYSAEEIAGKLITDFQPESNRHESDEALAQRLLLRTTKNRITHGGAVYLDRSGAEVHVTFSSIAMFDSEENLIEIRGTALDVTAERVGQEELRIQAAALEEASDAIVVVLPDNTIGYVNNAFVRDMGYSKEEAVGQDAVILRSATNPTELSARIWDTVNTGKTWRGTIVSKRKNGTTFTVDASISPVFTDDGSVTSFVSIRRDISERIRADQDRQARADLDAQNQQLQELSEQRDNFFSTVSHELRTPLTAVTAFADILSRNRDKNLSDGQLDQLDVIRRNGRSLINLVEDMLDLSRVNSSSLRLEIMPLEIDEMINSVVESLAPTTRERGQTIRFDSGTEGVWIHADTDRLVQILSNLLTNASKYSPHDTEVAIETTSDVDHIEWVVKDSGYGMSAEDLQLVFEPFFRSDRQEIRNQMGTGLGMPISKTLVELHGGQIDIESSLESGTVVRVRLPRSATDRV
jgi:PAS domain S-box-containing protein